MSTPDASLPKRPKGGMASLAADLTSRAGSLAHRSTDERLVPVVSAPGPARRPEVCTDLVGCRAPSAETSGPGIATAAGQRYQPTRTPSPGCEVASSPGRPRGSIRSVGRNGREMDP